MTISDSGLLNAEEGQREVLRRIVQMPRFKRKGVQRRRGWRKYRKRVTKTEEITTSSKKRKATSDPGYLNEESSEGYSTEASSCRKRVVNYKRFCAENRAWITSLDSGEGSNRKQGKGAVRERFEVEYENENEVFLEDMIGSSSDEEPGKAAIKDEENSSDNEFEVSEN